MAKDLNIIYDYKIKRPVAYSNEHLAKLQENPISHKDDWEKGCFEKTKNHIKATYYIGQNRRCAFCRKKLNADAYFDHIDHILPRKYYKKWMFKQKNLVVTCQICNSLKNDDDTLSEGFSKKSFPNTKAGFKIFNAHYEYWGSEFEIEDGMFIRGKTRRGERTITTCKLYQYHYSVQFASESGVRAQSVIKKASHRIEQFPPDSNEYKAAKKLIDYYERLI